MTVAREPAKAGGLDLRAAVWVPVWVLVLAPAWWPWVLALAPA
jgi:hypothetical protein